MRPSPEHATAHDVAARYRRTLLNSLGLAGVSTPADAAMHPAVAWARSGAMALTGEANGPPLIPNACIATCADAALQTLTAVTGSTAFDALHGSDLLAERAAIAGHTRGGTRSVGGSARLLRSATDWIALNLARDDDIATLPAWLETTIPSDHWTAVAHEVAQRDADALVARGRELGLPVARLGETPAGSPWNRIAVRGPDRADELARLEHTAHAPLVIDFSSLWAGPLAGHLLSLAGCRVIKIESLARPDGARRGPRAFYDLLNAEKESVALDFRNTSDLARLDSLIRRADIVIEASRPRALQQLGLDAITYLDEVPGLTWLSITGYGREAPFANRVAFGDDAAIAGGLIAHCPIGDAAGKSPMFCGDAIADPLTGLHAALAAYGSWRLGGGRLLDIAMSNVCAHVQGFAAMPDGAACVQDSDVYAVRVDDKEHRVTAPRARTISRHAAQLGAHTEAVVAELC